MFPPSLVHTQKKMALSAIWPGPLFPLGYCRIHSQIWDGVDGANLRSSHPLLFGGHRSKRSSPKGLQTRKALVVTQIFPEARPKDRHPAWDGARRTVSVNLKRLFIQRQEVFGAINRGDTS